MLNPKKIEEFARILHESIPKIIHDFKYDLDHKFRKILQNQIKRMNFVNRDEFDSHTHILLKTQEKLNQLESRLKILETLNQYKLTNCDNQNHLKNE